MKRLLVATAAFFFATSAFAQAPGTVTSNAFAVGRGAGKTGFASVLCTQAQLAVGQNAAAPICQTLSGDVTINASGVTAIGANKVTNAQLATAADGTIKSNISGGTAAPADNGISAVLDKLFGTTRGSIVFRGASAWSALAPGTSGFFLKSNGAGADPSYVAAPGSGTVTSVQLTAGAGISLSGTCTITTTGTCTVAQALTNAVTQVSGLSPTGTASGVGVMMGLGAASCRITPVYSGRIRISILGTVASTSSGSQATLSLRYGTGAGPANAAAASGTVALTLSPIIPGVNFPVPFNQEYIVTGLTTGVTSWFDQSLATTTGTASLANVACNAVEF